jgi:hypothetical protein
MHPRVFTATLKEDVITVLGPGCCKRSVNNGTSMALAPKFRMSDNIVEKPVLPPSAQEIWRGDKHTGGNDLGIRGGYEDRNAFVRQHFGPNLLGSRYRLHAGAYFRQLIEIKQRGEVRSFSKPSIGHLDTVLRITASLIFSTQSSDNHCLIWVTFGVLAAPRACPVIVGSPRGHILAAASSRPGAAWRHPHALRFGSVRP